MSVTNVEKDTETLTMTVTAELDATVERAWLLWADPRQFEQWWGPPGYPVTVVDHDLRTGGRITFSMAGDEGERHDSTWEVIAADPPHRLELRDADVDDDGRPNDGNAMTAMIITFDERDGGRAAMAIRTHFDSQAGMEQVLAMGIEEGMRMVFSQIDSGPRRHAGMKGSRRVTEPPMATIDANGVALGIESFGDHGAPLVLLAGGTTMLSWPDSLCERLAAGGRHVVRYDLRDSGESTMVDPEAPGTRCATSPPTPRPLPRRSVAVPHTSEGSASAGWSRRWRCSTIRPRSRR